jgi:phosphoribulokinase
MKAIKSSNFSYIVLEIDFKNSDMAKIPWMKYLLALNQVTVMSIFNDFVVSEQNVQVVMEKGAVS